MTKAWKEKRADITRLYIHENKTLNEVRAIMEEHHDFKASTRSYRQQFDKWGLAKYNCKKRTARRRSQDGGGGGGQHYHYQSAGQYYSAPAAGGGPEEGGAGGGDAAPDFPIADTDAYGQPMSPQSCGGSSLSSESAVDGGLVDDMMDAAGAAADAHAPEGSYARDWPPQLSYIEQGPQQQQQQGVPYPQYTQEQHQEQHSQGQMHQGRRRRPSWDQQTAAMQSPYGPLPSPPVDLHDAGGSSYYALFADDQEAGVSLPQPVRAETYPVLHPDPRRRGSYPHHQQARAQYQYQQHPRPSQTYSSAPLMPARRETVPFYGGAQCALRQSGQQ